jgi:hypothetical protein
MIQANILLPVAEKTASSFGVMDLMRWRRPEIASPPLDLLKFVNEHYAVV